MYRHTCRQTDETIDWYIDIQIDRYRNREVARYREIYKSININIF